MFLIDKLFGPRIDFKKIVSEGALILDVRTPAEYKAGHIPGAVNIPVDQLPKMTGELKKKNKKIITCCRSGMRSNLAAKELNKAGIETFNGGPWNSLVKKI